jgi:hypothetical protein
MPPLPAAGSTPIHLTMSPRAAQIPAPRRRRFTAADSADPPAEVLDAVGTAADVYDELQASGHHVHFDLQSNSGSGALTIQLLDADGNLLRTLSPSELLQLTTGAAFD